MYILLDLKTIKFALIKLSTDFYWQPTYLLGERASLKIIITLKPDMCIKLLQLQLIQYCNNLHCFSMSVTSTLV